MVLPSEASGGEQNTPDLTSNVEKAANDISKRETTEATSEETREKRQYYGANRHFGVPRYMPLAEPQRFYPFHQPIHYRRNGYLPMYGMHQDPDKPRISVHIEAEKKNYISHIDEVGEDYDDYDDDGRKKRQLFGMTSLMSPAQPIKSPLPSHGLNKENAKSEVPKHRSARETITEVPIRAEQHHGITKTSTNFLNEGETKKSTIQRIQRRHAEKKTDAYENEDEHAPIRKRQFVFNSEPPVVRATVKGEQSNTEHSPIGNLIKMIAGHNAKNILGLNSKSFDVFPGPLPDTKENSVWNIKSAEEGNTDQTGNSFGSQVAQALPQQESQEEYRQTGLESVEDSQRRADATKNAQEQAEAEKETFVKEQNDAVVAQTAAKIREQKLEEERALEREQQIEQEQELEQARANEMTRLVREQANRRFVDMSRVFPPVAMPTRPMMIPMQQMMNDADDDDDAAMAYQNQMVPTMPPTMMPIQPDDFHPTQMQIPMEAMAYQEERPMPPMPLMQPAPTAFLPTPPMMFVPTTGMMPFTEAPAPFFRELDTVHRPEVAHTSERGPYLQQYPVQAIRRIHHRRRWHAPTESPFHFSNFQEPEMGDEDQKPEVHVHIQTEKSRIPKGGKTIKGEKNNNS